jgi:hypothetical protein
MAKITQNDYAALSPCATAAQVRQLEEDVARRPETPVDLASRISTGYRGSDKRYYILIDGKQIYSSEDARDVALFEGQLLLGIKPV